MLEKQARDFAPYREAVRVSEGATMEEMVAAFTGHPRHHHLCMVDGEERLVGLVNRKRLFKTVFSQHNPQISHLVQQYQMLTSDRSGDLVLRHFVALPEDATVEAVVTALIKHNLNEIPIVDDDHQVLGFLTVGQILETWFQREEADR